MRSVIVALALVAMATGGCGRGGYLSSAHDWLTASLTPCRMLLQQQPGLSSGTYRISLLDGDMVVRCDMTTLGGGWTQAASLNATAEACPAGWAKNDTMGVCTLPNPSCGVSNVASWEVPIWPGQYSEVWGFVHAYQYFSTDAFASDTEDINAAFVDGVSITHGSIPRRPIWTFAAGLTTQVTPGSCPCMGGDPAPDWIGNHYFCEAGNTSPDWNARWYTTERLWDGNALGPTCETGADPRWFHRQLDQPTDDPLEIRILLDQCDENVGISELELWVR